VCFASSNRSILCVNSDFHSNCGEPVAVVVSFDVQTCIPEEQIGVSGRCLE